MSATKTGSPLAITSLIAVARTRGVSDVHIDPEHGVAFRLNKLIGPCADIALSAELVQAFVDDVLDMPARARFEATGQIDVTIDTTATGALRVHALHGRKGPRLAIRLLADAVPNLRDLGLPPSIESLVDFPSGLVLITGPPSSGKSTTLASLIEHLNQTRAIHVILVQESTEHFFRWHRSVITQFEVGRDVSNLLAGINGALHADPDVLAIAELRGVQVALAALQAAEAGHLVIAAVQSPSDTVTAVNRIVALFAMHEQEPIRRRLADSLRGVAALRLLSTSGGRGVRMAAEILIVTEAIRRLFRDGATHQVRSLLNTSLKDGSQTLERHLNELTAAGEITVGAARAVANHPNEIVGVDRGK
jgi:twitching motility protein PilT